MDDVFLYIVTFWWGSKRLERIEMPDMETCITAIEAMRSDISDGAESEAGIALFCAGREYRVKWNGEWQGVDND